MHPPNAGLQFSFLVPIGDKARGFTLIELLTVVAITAILAGIAVPAITGLSKSANLTSAGQQVEGLFETARQNAISRQTPTAVVILKSGGNEETYRRLTTFELVQGTSGSPDQWRQITAWQALPKGVVIDNETGASNFLNQSPALSPAMSAIQYGNALYEPGTDFSYQLFLPSGRLKSPPTQCNLTLVCGFYQGSTLRHTDQGAANYYSLLFIDATGQAKITRP